MKCQNEKCGKEHNGSYGSGKFCCLKCSKVRSPKYTDEWKQNLSESVKGSKKFQVNNKLAIKRRGIKRDTLICPQCKESFDIVPSRKKTYCSYGCYIKDAKNVNKNMGGYREGSGRGKKCWYDSKIAGKVYLQSTYELRYAQWLDKNDIVWKRNTKRFYYIFENKKHYYVPDFYLVNSNEYVETKGYKTEQDLAKWNQFPHALKILMKDDLVSIGAIL